MTAAPMEVAAPQTAWRDAKRYLWMLGAVLPAALLGAAVVGINSGVHVLCWIGPIFVYGVVPVVDLLVGVDSSNPPEGALGRLERDRYYRWLTYVFLPVQYAALVIACWEWSHGGLGFLDQLGMAITVGSVGGVAINAAHELGHKRDSVERWLSKIALAQTGYGHFYIEHNRGHHVRVSTPEDPASARLGEGFWAFWPRTVAGSLRSALRIERQRLARRGRGQWSIRNDVLNAWLMSLVLFAALAAAFGPGILPWLAVQAVFGFTLLEAVNYIEHYGLARGREPSGRYERVRPEHSWNSNNVTSNLLLYHLQRHSDHHANPTRRYQALRHFEEAPQLPSGYAAMIMLAYVPPLWRRVMDPRVLDHYRGDVTRANLHPPVRERLLARYGVAAQPAAGTVR